MSRARSVRWNAALIAAALGLSAAYPAAALAETLESALSRAYIASPIINGERASVRATDENVPRALSGYRPRISASADIGRTWSERELRGISSESALTPRGIGLQINQTIYNGGRTAASVRQAESQVFAARQNLEASVQDVLFQAAQAYMNVLRDTAILNLQRNNIDVLGEQLRQTQDRFDVGEVTRTDVAQSEARVAAARSQVSLAEANLRSSIAIYRRIVGVDPRQLQPGSIPARLIPRSVEAAVEIGLSQNPNITAARHALDAAQAQVRLIEGELLPTLGVQGAVNHRYDSSISGDRTTSAQIVARLDVPLYQGGEVSARVRQAKEIASQRRFDVDLVREQVRAAIIAAWGQLDASTAQIEAAQAQVSAAETALSGVREEARVGQRTTLDVLNAQQELLNARVNLITAQRDRVVAGYALVQAMGRLTPTQLALGVEIYDASVHFEQVDGLWYGTQTPSGQ
ncbi:TolC family outer membrane protein [Salinarimonas ramus]|uniref:Channel protein TolC n=1 Tax=Salinarimonas ramus TaxID=690164 RepID=A0A917QCM3_9HYPH|nr:TolC family outer membrane protein [Salinarimonas ramus]GGK43699.1 channel protein TolC [Salinarimonas ramus]